MRETKLNKMTEVRNVKALSWMMKKRVTGECSFRVIREGFLEAVTYTLK